MTALRRIARTRSLLVALVLLATLSLRLLVPAGYMPVMDGGRIIVALCSGTGPVRQVVVELPGAAGADMHHDGGSGMASPCAFADLALPVLGGVDPVLLVAALAFVMALAFVRRGRVPPRPAHRLRPPSQAPPLPA